MTYTVEDLTRDVMARLGEVPRPQSSLPADVPWPEDILGLKVRSLLPEVGARLIREAPLESLGVKREAAAGAGSGLEVRMVLMPCGLYGAEVGLPDGFLRLASVKMGEWTRGVTALSLPGESGWERQWSAEPGIAGCPGRPRAYVDHASCGQIIRLLGSRSPEDKLEWLSAWCVPVPDADGGFRFPPALYGALVSSVLSGIAEG